MEDLELNPSFWSEKNVFITGHTGFKGSWLSIWLQRLGSVVTGYSLLPPTKPSLFEIANVKEGMTSIINDIRDRESIIRELNNSKAEIVFHLAAQPLVRKSYIDPVETFETNIMGTVNLLEAVRNCPSVRSVVIITTDKCYENNEWVWSYREIDPVGGFDPYSSSKGCTELVTAAYRQSFFNIKNYSKHGVGLATCRAGNVIGGGDWANDRLVPDVITAFLNSEPVYIRNPKSIRPWQHVLEPLSGYLTLAEKLYENGVEYSEAWNFGPYERDAKNVEWIVKFISEKMNKQVEWSIKTDQLLHEAMHLKLDISKANNRLKWHPRWSIETSLVETIEWYKKWYEGVDMTEFTHIQIEKYLQANS